MIERKTWRDNILWIIVVSYVMIIAGELLGMVVIPQFEKTDGYMYTFTSYFSFITIWVVIMMFVYVFKKNRYIKEHIVMNKEGNTVKNLVIGLVIGLVLNLFCAFVAILNGDFSLQFSVFDFLPVLGLFIAVFIQSSAEEALCRGFMYQRLLKFNPNPIYAIIVNSIFFAGVHLGNSGINFLGLYDLFVTGVFFSLMVYYYDSLWMAMGAHATWNFSQSILLGLPNSGLSLPYSIFVLNTNNVKSSFAYDTSFGLEGTILSSSVMTISCVLIYVINKKKKIK